MSDDVYNWANDGDLEAFGLKVTAVRAIDVQRAMILCTPDGEPEYVVTRGATLATCPDCDRGHMMITVEPFNDIQSMDVGLNPADPVLILTGAWWT